MSSTIKKAISILFVITLLVQTIQLNIFGAQDENYGADNYFEDTKGHWCQKYIQDLYSNGAIKGYDENGKHYLKPDALITRAEFAQVLTKYLNVSVFSDVYGISFPDVNDNAWYKEPISMVSSKGFVKGYPDGTFKPENPIKRSEITALSASFVRKNGEAVEIKDASCFPDVNKGDWFFDDVAQLKEKGIADGYPDGFFKPERLATRAEAFKLLYNLKNAQVTKPPVTEPSPSKIPQYPGNPTPTTVPTAVPSTVPVSQSPVDNNNPPVVDAGKDQSIMIKDSLKLTGTATDDGRPNGKLITSWSKVSGNGEVKFEDINKLSTDITFSESGVYVLRLTASDGAKTAFDDVSITVDAIHKTYTLDKDFDEGEGINISRQTPDQLELDNTTKPFNFIWVAVSSKGTVVKINTDTGEVCGEYLTSPEGQPRNPSRTTVDHNGNVWVANRDGNSVVRIGLKENGQWIDKNKDGDCDTSDGTNYLPWPNSDGANTEGGVSNAQDECIITYTRVHSGGTRHVSVDKNNDVWVSGTGNRIFDLIDGNTGLIKRTEGPVGYGGYGGLIDKNGVIWSAVPLLRWDTSKPLSGASGENWTGYGQASYGLAIDGDGNVWCSEYGSYIRKFAPDGTLLGTYLHGGSSAQGCVADKNGDIWVAHSTSANTVGHLKNDGTFIGNVTVGSGPTGVAVDSKGKIWATNFNSGTCSRIDPTAGDIGADGKTPIGFVDYTTRNLGGNLYNYSDMTGSTLTGAPDQATWSAVYDSGAENVEWGDICWNGIQYNDSEINVSVCSSVYGDSYDKLEKVENRGKINVPPGRYLKVNVSFKRASNGKSPVLYDLTIGAAGYHLPDQSNKAPVVDAGKDAQVTIDKAIELTGNASDDCLPKGLPLSAEWSMVSGPGEVKFDSTNSFKTKATFDKPGKYVLQLLASDSVLSGKDTVEITVDALPAPTPTGTPEP